jgi:hypothetical protein
MAAIPALLDACLSTDVDWSLTNAPEQTTGSGTQNLHAYVLRNLQNAFVSSNICGSVLEKKTILGKRTVA